MAKGATATAEQTPKPKRRTKLTTEVQDRLRNRGTPVKVKRPTKASPTPEEVTGTWPRAGYQLDPSKTVGELADEHELAVANSHANHIETYNNGYNEGYSLGYEAGVADEFSRNAIPQAAPTQPVKVVPLTFVMGIAVGALLVLLGGIFR